MPPTRKSISSTPAKTPDQQLSKQERLALSRKKARAWAQEHSIKKPVASATKHTKTPVPTRKAPSTTGKLPSKQTLRSNIKKEELLDDEEQKLPLSKKERLAKARAKSRAWAEEKLSPTPKKIHLDDTGPTGTPKVKDMEVEEEEHSEEHMSEEEIDEKEDMEESDEEEFHETQWNESHKRQHTPSTPSISSAGRSKRSKPSATPETRQEHDAEESFFMSPETSISETAQAYVQAPTIPTFPTISTTPITEQFYDTHHEQQPTQDPRLIRTPLLNIINRPSHTIQSEILSPNVPPTPYYEACEQTPNQPTYQSIPTQPSIYDTNNVSSHEIQTSHSMYQSNTPQPRKTVRIDESKNNIHPRPKHGRLTSFITYFNIFDSCLGFFLKILFSFLILSFLLYCYSITLHPIEIATITPFKSNPIPPCFLPSPNNELYTIPNHHRTCNENNTIPCPEHGTCNGGFLLNCDAPFVMHDYDSCIPSKEILLELEEEMLNKTVKELCSKNILSSLENDRHPMLFASNYEQLYPYLDTSKYIIQNNTIGFTPTYLESNTLPISFSCAAKFHFINIITFFLKLSWIVIYHLLLTTIEYPLPTTLTVLIIYITNWILQKRKIRSQEKKLITTIQDLVHSKLQQSQGIQMHHLRDDIAYELYPGSLKDRKKMSISVWPKVVAIVRCDSRIRRVNRGRMEYWEWGMKDEKKD